MNDCKPIFVNHYYHFREYSNALVDPPVRRPGSTYLTNNFRLFSENKFSFAPALFVCLMLLYTLALAYKAQVQDSSD